MVLSVQRFLIRLRMDLIYYNSEKDWEIYKLKYYLIYLFETTGKTIKRIVSDSARQWHFSFSPVPGAKSKYLIIYAKWNVLENTHFELKIQIWTWISPWNSILFS